VRIRRLSVVEIGTLFSENKTIFIINKLKGFLYILECSDGSYYCGSTVDLTKRLKEHNNGRGANHTKKRLPVELVYVEEYDRIDKAFDREKQIQGWSRNKKEALINGDFAILNGLAECKNKTHYKYYIEVNLIG
jgi:putative endonuclease